MRLACLVYDNFTLLDLVGPLEVLTLLPDIDTYVCASEKGLVWPDNAAMPVVAPFAIDEIETSDLLLIPGGSGTLAAIEDKRQIEWIRSIDKGTRWTCSVCTGSLMLGAAGLLEGKDATTHWAMFEALQSYGATPLHRRWVEQGKTITGAGVSAGIDLALHLVELIAGETTAKAIQLAIEYDPAPPFTAGSPQSAGADVMSAFMTGATAIADRAHRSRPNLPVVQA